MATIQALQFGNVFQFFTGQINTNTPQGVAVPASRTRCNFEIVGTGTISSGTVVLEENGQDPNYAGTWSQITSISASTLTGGASQVVHIEGSMVFVRWRISVAIGGGGSVAGFAYAA